MSAYVRLQVLAKELLERDLLSGRFYARRLTKHPLSRSLKSLVQTKIPYSLPLPRLPYVIVFEPTTHCNLRCIMCPSPGFTGTRGYLSMELYEKLIRQAIDGGVHRARFVGLGEPMLHRNLPEMVRMAKQGGLYTEISTNATLLTRELGQALLDAGLDELCFSLDTAIEADYERIRKPAKYSEVVSNIEGFLALCKENPARAPVTVARMVVMEGSDVEAFSRRWEGKVDSLQFNIMRVHAGAESPHGAPRTPPTAAPRRQLPRRTRCRQIMNHMLIEWDGHISLCNQCSVLIGDANTTSLEAIWKGAVMQKVRGLHTRYQGGQVKMCRVCPVMAPAFPEDDRSKEPASVTTRIHWRDDMISKPGAW